MNLDPTKQTAVGGGKVMHSKTRLLLLVASRPWQLTGIDHVLKCFFLHEYVGGDFRGSPVEVQSSSDGNMCCAPSGEQEIPLSP